MKKIVIASDSFKGSLSSIEVAKTIYKAIQYINPKIEIIQIPIADGGEGLTHALIDVIGGKIIETEVLDPLQRPITATYAITQNSTAIVEIAAASGLPLVEERLRNPLKTTTFGTGMLIKDAIERGCRDFIIGLGGSATNDAGIGMMQSLGFKFYSNKKEIHIATGADLKSIDKIDCSDVNPAIKDCKFSVACDVANTLYGKNGAAYIFAPQKGADKDMVRELDLGLEHFAKLIKKEFNLNINNIDGAGAAGGVGGGMVALLDAKLKPGIEVVLEYLNFDKIIKGADLIITGEGSIDKQTLMGKAPVGVLNAAKKQNIPTIAIAGRVEDKDLLTTAGFTSIIEVSPRDLPLEVVMQPNICRENIEKAISLLIEI